LEQNPERGTPTGHAEDDADRYFAAAFLIIASAEPKGAPRRAETRQPVGGDAIDEMARRSHAGIDRSDVPHQAEVEFRFRL